MTTLPLNPCLHNLRIPISAPMPIRHGRADHTLSTKDTAALLRRELKRHFPFGRFTVRVEHEWHGWIRIRVAGVPVGLVSAFTGQLALLRYDSDDNDHWTYAMAVEDSGEPCFIRNYVRSIKVEWTG